VYAAAMAAEAAEGALPASGNTGAQSASPPPPSAVGLYAPPTKDDSFTMAQEDVYAAAMAAEAAKVASPASTGTDGAKKTKGAARSALASQLDATAHSSTSTPASQLGAGFDSAPSASTTSQEAVRATPSQLDGFAVQRPAAPPSSPLPQPGGFAVQSAPTSGTEQEGRKMPDASSSHLPIETPANTDIIAAWCVLLDMVAKDPVMLSEGQVPEDLRRQHGSIRDILMAATRGIRQLAAQDKKAFESATRIVGEPNAFPFVPFD